MHVITNKRFLLIAPLLLLTFSLVNCSRALVDGIASLNPLSKTIKEVVISPANSTIQVGETEKLEALVIYEDDTSDDITESVTWTNLHPDILNMQTQASSIGRLQGIRPGNAIIVATYRDFSIYAMVRVTAAALTRIEITPLNSSSPLGTNQQFHATGIYSDLSNADITAQVAWSSSNENIATISNSNTTRGLARTVAAGSINITATLNSITAQTPYTVSSAALSSIVITETTASLANGLTKSFTATGRFSDNSQVNITHDATWSSSDSSVFTVSNSNSTKGTITATGVGSGTLTASFGLYSAQAQVTVTSATLSSLTIQPSNATGSIGTPQQFTLIGTYSDNTTVNLTESATWSTSDPSKITISNVNLLRGLAQTTNEGSSTITANFGAMAATTSFATTSATLSSIQVQPSSVSIPQGTSQTYQAQGTYSDGSTLDISQHVTWSVANPAIGSISNAAVTRGTFSSSSQGSTQVTATLNSVSGNGTIQVTAPVLSNIVISPASGSSLALGYTQPFTATGYYTDGYSANLTSSVTWNSSDSSKVSISNTGGTKGIASSVAVGSTVISATMGSVSASVNFSITPAVLTSIQILPTSISIPLGGTQTLQAIGTYSDSSTADISSSVSWSVNDPSIGAITNTNTSYIFSSATQGSTQITASINSVTTSVPAQVNLAALASIAITPDTGASVALGQTQQFTAIGTYTNGTTADVTSSISWTSSVPARLSVNNSGLATSHSTGSVTVTATSGAISKSINFTVATAALSSIQVTPSSPSIALGTTQAFHAQATYTDASTADITSSVTWSVDDGAIGSISNSMGARGTFTSIAQGSTQVKATMSAIVGSSSIQVTTPTLVSVAISPSSGIAIALGQSQQFTATGTYSDGSTANLSSTTNWTSSDPSKLSVSSSGLVTSHATGLVTLTATSGSRTTNVSFTIAPAVLTSIQVSPNAPSVALGGTQAFQAQGTYSDSTTADITSSVTWSVVSGSIGSINSSGTFTADNIGNTQVRATLSSVTGATNIQVGNATLSSIAITPANASVALGYTHQFTATGTYSDGSTVDITPSVAWSSSNTSRLTISNNGLASSVATGAVTITATSGSQTASVNFNVSAPILTNIQVTPSSQTIALGLSQAFHAQGTYSDSSTSDITSSVTWSVGSSSVGTIDNTAGNKGIFSSSGTGTTQVIATLSSVSGNASIQVTGAALTSISITPANASVALGYTQQFIATGTYTNGATADITSSVTWNSSDSARLTLSNSGLGSSVATGIVTVSATSGSRTASVNFTVSAPVLTNIQVNPATPSIALGLTQAFQAQGTYSDLSSADITSSVTWSVVNSGIGSINSAGLFSSLAQGSTQVRAILSSITGTATAQVTAPVLSSIAITPSNASVALGFNQQFTATGTYTNGSTANITSSVTWSSADTSKLTVNSTGLASTVATGSTSITATSGSRSATVNFSVTAAVLTNIQVTPGTPSVALGLAQGFQAQGTYSDASTANITSSVTWSVVNSSIGSINSSGLFTSLGTGTTQVRATLSSITGTASMQVTAPTLSSVAITPNSASIALGYQQQFTATGTYTDGSTANISSSVSWSSSDTGKLTLNTSGLASTLATGSVSITATSGSRTHTVNFSVTAAVLTNIQVTPGTPSVALGLSQAFQAQGTYSDSSTANLTSSVTWSVVNAGIGSVASTGVFSSLAQGTTQVRATLSSITGTASIQVTAPSLSSITINPTTPSVPLGLTEQFTATGNYSDGSTQNITAVANWSSSATGIAQIGNSGGSKGLLSTVTQGLTTITVSYGGRSATTNSTVSAPVLTSIVVTPTTTSILLGVLKQFTATGYYSNGTSANISSSVTWSIGAGAIGTISSNGLFLGIVVGSTTVTATIGSYSSTSTVTVTSLL